MRDIALIILMAALVLPLSAGAISLDDLKEYQKEYLPGGGEGLSEETIVSGLKEALRVGTKRAVKKVSKVDGYLKNPKITIPFPEKIEKVASTLRKVGLESQVEEFVGSMNQAAEKAAPKSVDIFVGAVKRMSFSDAKRILAGSNTEATDFFKKETSKGLYKLFKPVVSSVMDDVGVTRSYKKIMDDYSNVPFVESQNVDLDDYVTRKALEGLFYMVGVEEKKIRKDPAARTTELLKKVFSE
ncbi:MAG: DUF4197 domain-containing protein [Thermodesulfovibrionales bacterium]|nr:DUF4197 domain-containing protein [Thermodesulfovibrionales bacterium]